MSNGAITKEKAKEQGFFEFYTQAGMIGFAAGLGVVISVLFGSLALIKTGDQVTMYFLICLMTAFVSTIFVVTCSLVLMIKAIEFFTTKKEEPADG